MAFRTRRYGKRLVGWCDSCGFLVEARPDQDHDLLGRLRRHRAEAHGGHLVGWPRAA
jgi:hypothetical protein